MTGVIVNGKPFGGPGGCLKGGVAIGGERSGNGGDGGDFGLLGDGVGVGGGAPWGFGLGPHGGGNGEGDGGGGGFTLAADCCPGCVCRFAGGRLTGSCTAGTEDADCCWHSHAGIGGALTGGCAAGSNDSEGADCWEGGCLCSFAGGASRACWAQLACEGGMRGRRGRNWAPQIGRKSLHSPRSMLAGQQITPLMKISAFLSEFEPKYLQTSIALWVDGGSQEAQCG